MVWKKWSCTFKEHYGKSNMFITRLYGMVFLNMVDLRGPRWWKKWRRSFAVSDEVRESFDMHSGTHNFFYCRLYASWSFTQIHGFSMCMYLRRKQNTPIICIIVFGQSTCLETLKFWLNVFLPKARSPS